MTDERKKAMAVAAAKKRAEKREKARLAQVAKIEKDRVAEAQKAEREKTRAVDRAEKIKRAAEKRALERERKAEREKLAAEKAKLTVERQNRRRAARAVVYKKVRACLKNDKDGFDYRNLGLIPRVTLRVKGDGASIASRMCAAGISMLDLQKDGAFYRFKIRKKDLRKAIAIFTEMCYNYEVCDRIGVGRLLSFWRARVGILVGAAVAAVALNISYSYVWRIDVSGNERITDGAIVRALAESGIKSGTGKRKLSLQGVTAAVNRLDGVSDASAEIVGTTLFVYVLESSDYEVESAFDSYESAYDATITRIVMRKGTATVKRGDVVAAGETLADGSVYSTAGELLYVGECNADIYGTVSITSTCELSKSAVEYRYTGRTAVKTQFELFGCKIGKVQAPFKSYDSASRLSRYDVLIPLYVTRYEYRETAPVTVERELDVAVSEFAESERERLRFIGEFDYSYTVTPTAAGLYRVSVFMTGEALVSRGKRK